MSLRGVCRDYLQIYTFKDEGIIIYFHHMRFGVSNAYVPTTSAGHLINI